MIIKKIELDGFGKFCGNSYFANKGFNIILGNNEDGKTTIMSFIKMMFYSSSSKSEKGTDLFKSLRKKYRPWNGSTMSGAIEFEHNNLEYRLQKQFLKSDITDKTTIFCKTTGEELVIENKNDPGEYFFGMTLDEFDRSVFIGQSGGFSTDGTTDSLAMRISNLAVSGDEKISHQQILKRLNDAIEELISKSGKKGILATEQNILEELEFEEQKQIQLEEDQKSTQAQISKLEEEILALEQRLNSVTDGERLEAYKKELNIYYALRNKLNLLNTITKKLDEYQTPKNQLLEYIKESEAIVKEIDETLMLIQEATTEKLSLTIPEEVYSKLIDLSSKKESLEKDINFAKTRICELYKELVRKTSRSVNSFRILSAVIFAAIIGVSGFLFFSFSKSLYWVFTFGIGAVIFAVMLGISKTAGRAKFPVELAKRDLEGAIRQLENFNEDMLSKTPEEIEKELENLASETQLMLENGLKENNCSDISQLRSASSAARTLNIENLTSQLNTQKESLINVTSSLKPVSTFSAAKIFFVELKEALSSFDSINSEISSICQLSKITDSSDEAVDSRIKFLVDFISKNPEPTPSSRESISELRSTLKERRLLLAEYMNSIKHSDKSLHQISEEIKQSKARIAQLSARYQELKIAREVMNEAIADTNNGLGPRLSEKVSEYLKELSCGKDFEVLIPRDFSLETRTSSAEGFHEWKYLSSGAIDRLYLALRLSITDILSSGSNTLPLFFDDILAQYDDESCRCALEFLKKYLESSMSTSQIMFFTCHKHIADMAKNIFDDLTQINL